MTRLRFALGCFLKAWRDFPRLEREKAEAKAALDRIIKNAPPAGLYAEFCGCPDCVAARLRPVPPEARPN